MEELRVALTTKLRAILEGCSSVMVLKDGVVQSELLHKAR
jgi:hypothetical protein